MIKSQQLEKLETIVTGRTVSLFSVDVLEHLDNIREQLIGARVLVIGAAGSIGGAFTREISQFDMQALHLIDLSENNLVEVVRDLRSSGLRVPDNFATFALDFTSAEMESFFSSAQPYDFVFNFAALKHVRAERDEFTLMRMLITNVVGNEQLLNWLNGSPPKRFFSVSSDKAVRPANLMGASKAFMERVMLSHAERVDVSSARFANVAYSDGSLLHGFNKRIEKRQPISAPSDVRRYFISHREAAQLCLLSAFIGSNRAIFYPKIFTIDDALSFAEIARRHIQVMGLEPVEVDSDAKAVAFMKSEPVSSKRWACYFSSSHTSGEKYCEEFVAPSERTDRESLATVGIVESPVQSSRKMITSALSRIGELRAGGSWKKDELLEIVSQVVPELEHSETHRNLDQRM